MIEARLRERQAEDVRRLEGDVAEASAPDGGPGGFNGNGRSVNGGEAGLRIVPGEDDGLGADAAARLQHVAAGRVESVVVQQVRQRLRLIVQPLALAL